SPERGRRAPRALSFRLTVHGGPAWAHQSSAPRSTPVSGESDAPPSRIVSADHGGGMIGKRRKCAPSYGPVEPTGSRTSRSRLALTIDSGSGTVTNGPAGS